jgi:hypothetical protein
MTKAHALALTAAFVQKARDAVSDPYGDPLSGHGDVMIKQEEITAITQLWDIISEEES